MLEIALKNSDSLVGESKLEASELKQLTSQPAQPQPTLSADIFKHTFVDVPDISDLPSSAPRKEVFFFYNYSFEMP